jgi:chemotaxis signal transduction protein
VSSVYRDIKKSYVRDTATRLTTAGSTTLSLETSFTLVCLFQDLVNSAKKCEIDTYVPVFEACQQLCEAAEHKSLTGQQIQQANEVLREAVITLQTSLFTFALYNDPDRHQAKLKDTIGEILQFLKNVKSASKSIQADSENQEEMQVIPLSGHSELPHSAPQPPLSGSAYLSDSDDIIPASGMNHFDPRNREQSEDTFIPAPHSKELLVSNHGSAILLQSVAKLTEKLWVESDYQKETLQVVQSTLQTFGIPFSRICHRIAESSKINLKTTTPDFRVEPELAQAIGAQLENWLEIQGTQHVKVLATIRQVGKVIWLEICLQDRYVMTSNTLGKKQISTQNSDDHASLFSQSYLDNKGSLVQRCAFDVTIPLFEAYQVIAHQRIFLIPSADVIKEPMRETKSTPRYSLKDFPGFSLHPPQAFAGQKIKQLFTSSKQTLPVLWRETPILLEVDSFEGPQHYISRNLDGSTRYDLDTCGIASLPDGRSALIIDVFPWLDRRNESARVKEVVPQDSKTWVNKKMLFFKTGDVKMAIPAEKVMECGQLNQNSWTNGLIEIKGRVFRIQSLKSSMGIREGAVENFYIIVSTPSGPVAWAVSMLEGIQAFPESQLNAIEIGAPYKNIQFVQGTFAMSGIKNVPGSHTYYLINPDSMEGDRSTKTTG